MTITSDQIRAARSLLRLKQDYVARQAHISMVTLRRLEGAKGTECVSPSIIGEVRQALEAAGVEFIEGGVRRRKKRRHDTDAIFSDLRQISMQSAALLKGHSVLNESDLYDENGLPA